MTIDRSYLPFKSAREYQDRKMAKWMGFFLSEHATALSENSQMIDFGKTMLPSEKMLLLNKAYSNGLTLQFIVIKKGVSEIVIGKISQLSQELVGVQAENIHYMINIEYIMAMSLVEVIENEY